jgi:hypothetical protein
MVTQNVDSYVDNIGLHCQERSNSTQKMDIHF